MMNTLANHGYLPRDGRNITLANAVSGLKAGLNFEPSLVKIMWNKAIIANPTPNATYFTLAHLNRHNVLEHDASLSRSDAYFGSNHIFNQTVFDQSRSVWQGGVLDVQQIANAKLLRMVQSRATNPEYAFTAHTEQFSLGEMAAPFIAFGDLDTVLVNRSLVEYFFGQFDDNFGRTQKKTSVSKFNQEHVDRKRASSA